VQRLNSAVALAMPADVCGRRLDDSRRRRSPRGFCLRPAAGPGCSRPVARPTCSLDGAHNVPARRGPGRSGIGSAVPRRSGASHSWAVVVGTSPTSQATRACCGALLAPGERAWLVPCRRAIPSWNRDSLWRLPRAWPDQLSAPRPIFLKPWPPLPQALSQRIHASRQLSPAAPAGCVVAGSLYLLGRPARWRNSANTAKPEGLRNGPVPGES